MADAAPTVLLVEDEASIRMVAERMLEMAGFRIVACASGEDAIDVARSPANRFDVLLTDVGPDGVGGREVAEAVRAARPQVGVVLMSGYPADVVLGPGVVEGARFLAKPYTRRELVAAVEAALGWGTAGNG